MNRLILCYILYSVTFFSLSESVPVRVVPGGVQLSVYEGPRTCSEKFRIGRGDYVRLHYEGYFVGKTSNDVVFFGSSKKAGPLEILIGEEGKTLGSWDLGLIGLCKGSKAVVVIPPHARYRRHMKRLLFRSTDYAEKSMRLDVNVLDVMGRRPPTPSTPSTPPVNNVQRDLFREIDSLGNGDGMLSANEITKLFLKERLEITDEYLAAIFDQEDKNGDGLIAWDEFSGLKGVEPPPVSSEL